MQNASFAAEDMDYVYIAMDVEPEDLSAAVQGAVVMGFRGLTLTMPHKQAVLPLLDDMAEEVRISGAANTVVIEDSQLHGYNTDGSGLMEACAEADIQLKDSRIVLLGAGGLGRAIAAAADGEGIADLYVVDVDDERAQELVSSLKSAEVRYDVEAFSLEKLEEVAQKADVIVNATPLGMRREDPLPVSADLLNGNTAVCDAVYLHDEDTPLIQAARERGARTVTGKRLLLYQGVRAQRLWTGHEPNVSAMSATISSSGQHT
jgi:shikimate dehydrogenase